MISTVQRKCRVGQVWRYATGGFASVVSVTPFDYAPQCGVILCDHNGAVQSKYPDGMMREIGIMERELVELIGEWTPAFSVPTAEQQPTKGSDMNNDQLSYIYALEAIKGAAKALLESGTTPLAVAHLRRTLQEPSANIGGNERAALLGYEKPAK